MFRIGWQEKLNTNSRRRARPVRWQWNQGRRLTLETLEERTLLSFLDGVNYDVGKTPWSVAAGDLNGDGIPDLVTANIHDNAVSVLLGNGDGTFQAARSVGIGAPTYGVAVGDFNGDGIPDLAFASYDI